MLVLPTPHVASTQEKDALFSSLIISAIICHFLYAIMSSLLCFLTHALPFLHTQKCPQHGFWVLPFFLAMIHRNQRICAAPSICDGNHGS